MGPISIFEIIARTQFMLVRCLVVAASSIPVKRIWSRTNCNFDESGSGGCETGDCNSLLECQSYGAPPNTLAEYALNQYNNLDFFDISLVDGFNVPMEFSPNSDQCSRGIGCTADVPYGVTSTGWVQ